MKLTKQLNYRQVYFNPLFIKRILKLKESISNFRIYLICTKYYAHRSGIFSMDELLNVLHKEFKVKSLHTKPGNYRKTYSEKLKQRFNKSILFRPLSDGRYRIISNRKIIHER